MRAHAPSLGGTGKLSGLHVSGIHPSPPPKQVKLRNEPTTLTQLPPVKALTAKSPARKNARPRSSYPSSLYVSYSFPTLTSNRRHRTLFLSLTGAAPWYK
jgi:hypothetical protein